MWIDMTFSETELGNCLPVSYWLLSWGALCDSRASLMLSVPCLSRMKNCAMATYLYARSLMIINARMYMHVFSLKYKDERVCMDIRLLRKTSILKKVQKGALPCAPIVHVNYIYKQSDTKLQSGGKHFKKIEKIKPWYCTGRFNFQFGCKRS